MVVLCKSFYCCSVWRGSLELLRGLAFVATIAAAATRRVEQRGVGGTLRAESGGRHKMSELLWHIHSKHSGENGLMMAFRLILNMISTA